MSGPRAIPAPQAVAAHAQVNPQGYTQADMNAAIAAAVARATAPTPAVVTAEEMAAAVAAAIAEGKRLAEQERRAAEDLKEEEERKAKLEADHSRLVLALAASVKADADRKVEEERLSRENEIKHLRDELAKKTQLVVHTNPSEMPTINKETIVAVAVVIVAACIMYLSLQSQVSYKTSAIREQNDHEFRALRYQADQQHQANAQTLNLWTYELQKRSHGYQEENSQYKELAPTITTAEKIEVEVPSYFWTYTFLITFACFVVYYWFQVMDAEYKKERKLAIQDKKSKKVYDSDYYPEY
jgi:hypothetical protein